MTSTAVASPPSSLLAKWPSKTLSTKHSQLGGKGPEPIEPAHNPRWACITALLYDTVSNTPGWGEEVNQGYFGMHRVESECLKCSEQRYDIYWYRLRKCISTPIKATIFLFLLNDEQLCCSKGGKKGNSRAVWRADVNPL